MLVGHCISGNVGIHAQHNLLSLILSIIYVLIVHLHVLPVLVSSTVPAVSLITILTNNYIYVSHAIPTAKDASDQHKTNALTADTHYT